MGQDPNDLVSIALMTYNSQSTILDTLNSILKQSYNLKKIDLVISDDASVDFTKDIITKWLSAHQDKFFRVKLISSDSNKGVTGNLNSAYKESKGEWVKCIAGDDVLLDCCIAENIAFVKKKLDVNVVFSDLKLIVGGVFCKNTNVIPVHFFELNASEQYKVLLLNNVLSAPTLFIRTSVLQSVGYLDESYPMMEDYPLWIKLVKSGVKLDYLPKVTVGYRIGDSLSRQTKTIGNVKYLQSNFNFCKEHIWPNWKGLILFLRELDERFVFFEKTIAINIFKNKKSKIYYICHAVTFLFRPYYWINKFFFHQK
jgi:glycosyltransferase involved in cell wall biosynthesis